MTWIDLGNPILRQETLVYDAFVWPDGAIRYLSKDVTADKKFYEVAISRRSRRTFEIVDEDSIAKLFWITSCVQATGNHSLGFPLSKRPTPSAGAIHPIHVLIALPESQSWVRYDPFGHALIEVKQGMESACEVRKIVEKVLPVSSGALLLFIAEPGKTFSKYANGNSLVWRDAGVMLGYFALASEALGLNFCPLGVTGEPWASKLDGQNRLFGVGMAIFGSS